MKNDFLSVELLVYQNVEIVLFSLDVNGDINTLTLD